MTKKTKQSKLYKVVAKYDGELDAGFAIEAISDVEAGDMINRWNRYHGRSDSYGFGFCVAKEVARESVNTGLIRNNWIPSR